MYNSYVSYIYKDLFPYNLKKKKISIHGNLISSNLYNFFEINGLKKDNIYSNYYFYNNGRFFNNIFNKLFSYKKLSVFFISNINMIESKWYLPITYHKNYNKNNKKKIIKYNFLKKKIINKNNFSILYNNYLYNNNNNLFIINNYYNFFFKNYILQKYINYDFNLNIFLYKYKKSVIKNHNYKNLINDLFLENKFKLLNSIFLLKNNEKFLYKFFDSYNNRNINNILMLKNYWYKDFKFINKYYNNVNMVSNKKNFSQFFNKFLWFDEQILHNKKNFNKIFFKDFENKNLNRWLFDNTIVLYKNIITNFYNFEYYDNSNFIKNNFFFFKKDLKKYLKKNNFIKRRSIKKNFNYFKYFFKIKILLKKEYDKLFLKNFNYYYYENNYWIDYLLRKQKNKFKNDNYMMVDLIKDLKKNNYKIKNNISYNIKDIDKWLFKNCEFLNKSFKRLKWIFKYYFLLKNNIKNINNIKDLYSIKKNSDIKIIKNYDKKLRKFNHKNKNFLVNSNFIHNLKEMRKFIKNYYDNNNNLIIDNDFYNLYFYKKNFLIYKFLSKFKKNKLKNKLKKYQKFLNIKNDHICDNSKRVLLNYKNVIQYKFNIIYIYNKYLKEKEFFEKKILDKKIFKIIKNNKFFFKKKYWIELLKSKLLVKVFKNIQIIKILKEVKKLINNNYLYLFYKIFLYYKINDFYIEKNEKKLKIKNNKKLNKLINNKLKKYFINNLHLSSLQINNNFIEKNLTKILKLINNNKLLLINNKVNLFIKKLIYLYVFSKKQHIDKSKKKLDIWIPLLYNNIIKNNKINFSYFKIYFKKFINLNNLFLKKLKKSKYLFINKLTLLKNKSFNYYLINEYWLEFSNYSKGYQQELINNNYWKLFHKKMFNWISWTNVKNNWILFKHSLQINSIYNYKYGINNKKKKKNIFINNILKIQKKNYSQLLLKTKKEKKKKQNILKSDFSKKKSLKIDLKKKKTNIRFNQDNIIYKRVLNFNNYNSNDLKVYYNIYNKLKYGKYKQKFIKIKGYHIWVAEGTLYYSYFNFNNNVNYNLKYFKYKYKYYKSRNFKYLN